MNTKFSFFFNAALLFFLALTASAQENQTFTLTAENLQNARPVALDKLQWKYHAGDEAAWANPQADDSAWDVQEGTYVNPQKLPPGGWNGRAWFRLHLTVDQSLVNRTLALTAVQRGASEIYLDGEKIAT